MKIIEQQLIGKHSQETCEDGIIETDNFIAVIDGSTSKTSNCINDNTTNGRYCMQLLSTCIKNLEPTIGIKSFCEYVTSYIHQVYICHNIDLHMLSEHPEERLTASLAIFSKFHNQVWMIGDCQCIVDGKFYENPKPTESLIAEKRATYIAKKLAINPQQSPESLMIDGRNHILPDLLDSMQAQNLKYAVIDGFPIYRNGIKIIPVISHVILATDGYPFLKQTLADSENALRKQLEHDPMNISSFKATKGLMSGNVSFDDRAYISFRTIVP
ncbi:hypothetical protein [Prevotella phocaeensis]|uniref:hypothetical protein n=2 Tax=Prevotellaceae TaxID=171552 RepID=UPI000569F9AA|nr:hypothetical protein [Prevotella phocaeensis]